MTTPQLKKFSGIGRIISDRCMGAGSTAKDFLLAPKCFKFFEFKAYDFCYLEAKPSVWYVFSRQALDVDSDENEPKQIE